MSNIKTISSEKLLHDQLKNSNFRKEYEKLEKDFLLSKEIINLRLQAQLTQNELAKKAHTSQSAIARVESGEYKNISLRFLNKIADALNAIPEIHLRKV